MRDLLTWEEKMAALDALDHGSIKMREPGNWYTSHNIMVSGDGFHIGKYGQGTTPEEAVLDAWSKYVKDLPADRYLYVSTTHRRVRWTGFMWKDVDVN